jgi:hypothetical protein
METRLLKLLPTLCSDNQVQRMDEALDYPRKPALQYLTMAPKQLYLQH